MDYRTLDLTIVSAKGLKKASLIGKMDVYAVASIFGTAGNVQKYKTPVDKDGGSDPTWNIPMKFTVDEAAGLQNRLTLVIEIKAVGMFGDKDVGEVHVPIKELLEGVKAEGREMKFVSYQVRRPSGKPKGDLSFSYKFGENFSGKAAEEPVTAYPAGMAVGTSSSYPPAYAAAGGYYPPPANGYPPQSQTGYAYQHQQQPGHAAYPPPPPPGYGGYPPQQGYGYPPVQQPQQPPKKSKMGMGLGAGLLGGALGGLLIGDMISDASGGCGGGCGGF
ncbi:protein SRC2-like [Cynara cardunculus var. scolymus]|uniref:C2 calcium-dependent membrane targeting n=1 Tax=Cynara cardunculus var. scolymus TaxID=59895 RepID=A0A103XFN8_CYNCS|nr:protein SRC2-like [Cynara cardunculus var. scolymus]KVH89871.1 C2 calcium-dependent membrane targeting [Cynara cardunculus var. scolymus]